MLGGRLAGRGENVSCRPRVLRFDNCCYGFDAFYYPHVYIIICVLSCVAMLRPARFTRRQTSLGCFVSRVFLKKACRRGTAALLRARRRNQVHGVIREIVSVSVCPRAAP